MINNNSESLATPKGSYHTPPSQGQKTLKAVIKSCRTTVRLELS